MHNFQTRVTQNDYPKTGTNFFKATATDKGLDLRQLERVLQLNVRKDNLEEDLLATSVTCFCIFLFRNSLYIPSVDNILNNTFKNPSTDNLIVGINV